MTQATFGLRGRNPDVLTCIANLSNDEVVTPPNLVNQMLDAAQLEKLRDLPRGVRAFSRDGADGFRDRLLRYFRRDDDDSQDEDGEPNEWDGENLWFHAPGVDGEVWLDDWDDSFEIDEFMQFFDWFDDAGGSFFFEPGQDGNFFFFDDEREPKKVEEKTKLKT